MNKKELDVSITTKIYKTFSRYDYSISSAVAEFVDNSTASILNNINYYVNKQIKPFVFIVFNRDDKVIEIFDNGFGIDMINRNRVFKLDNPPADTNGRNEFGMGLKNAGFWCGNQISIKTKSINESEYYHLNFDISNVDKDDYLAYEEMIDQEDWLKEYSKYNINADINFTIQHGTYLRIDTSNQNIKTQTIQKTIKEISSYYNEDIDDSDERINLSNNQYRKITIKVAELKKGIFYDLSYFQPLNNKPRYKRQISKFYNDCLAKFQTFSDEEQVEMSKQLDPIIEKIIDLKNKEDSYWQLSKQYERLTTKWKLFSDTEKYDPTFIGNTNDFTKLKQLISYKPEFAKLDDFQQEIENKKIDKSVYVDNCFKVLLNFSFKDFNNNLYTARGFMALLSPDFTGRDKAGIKLYRRGRLIREDDNDFYKPKIIFKDQGSFEYQRIYGEIHIDDLPCSQSKTKLKWDEETKANFNEEILKIIEKPICQMAKLPYKVRNTKHEYKYSNKEKIKDNIQFLLKKDNVEVSSININDDDKVWRISVSKDVISNYHFIYEIKPSLENGKWIDVIHLDADIDEKYIVGLETNDKDDFFKIQLDNGSPWLNPLNDNENAIDKIIELITTFLTKTIVFAHKLQELTTTINLIQELVDILNEEGVNYERITY